MKRHDEYIVFIMNVIGFRCVWGNPAYNTSQTQSIGIQSSVPNTN